MRFSSHPSLHGSARFLLTAMFLFVASSALAQGSWQGGTNTWSGNAWAGAGGTGIVPNGIGAIALFNNNTGGTTTQDISGLIVGTISYNGQLGNNARTINTSPAASPAGLPITLNQDGPGPANPGVATIDNLNTNTGTGQALIFGTAAAPGEIILADDVVIGNKSENISGGATNGAIQIFSTISGAGNVTFSSTASIGAPTNSSFLRAVRLQNTSTPNTFVGSVLIQKGLVAFDGASFGDAANVITLGEENQGSAMMIATAGTAIVANNLVVAANSGGTLTFGASSNSGFTVHAGTITLNGDANLRGGTATQTNVQTYSGVISGVGGLTKVGGGAISALTAENTYTGKTNVQVGSIRVSSLNRVVGGTASSGLGAPTTVANGTIGLGGVNNAGAASTGILSYIGAGETTDRVIDLAGTTGGAGIESSGTGALVLTSDFTATGAGAKALTLQGTSTDNNTIAGVIVDSTEATSLAKTDVGKWVLSGTNNYTGTTTVSGGTLLVNGSNSGGGAYSVATGGTFGGTGSIGSSAVTVDAGGTLAPGASIGTFAIGSAAIAGTLSIEFNGDTDLIDRLNAAGNLDISNAAVTFTNLGTAGLSGGPHVLAAYGSLTGASFLSVSGMPDGYAINYSYLSNNQIALVSSAHAGDFDSDGDVDGADFVAWQTHFPTAMGATLADGDADSDGDVDGADFVVWQTNFPFTPGPGASPVPEPAAWMLAIVALGVLARTSTKTNGPSKA